MRHRQRRDKAVGSLLAIALVAGLPGTRAWAAPDAFDDRWLSAAVMEEFARAAKQPDWPSAEKRAQALIVQRLACGHLDKMGALNDLVYVLRASRYLPMADRADPTGKLSSWLAANRDVSRLLLRALPEAKSPEESLKKFQALLAADEKRVLAYANLAVAFAVSQPMTHYVKQPDPMAMLESFQWFTNPKGTFRYDLKAMPFELSQYLADTQLSLAERQWAQRYAGRGDLAGTYLDVKFDGDYFFRGAPKKLTKLKYTLPNIPQADGVCLDQAYFASQVRKTMGVPATIVIGRNAAGGAHAWVAAVKIRTVGGQLTAEWDASTGRYEEQRYYTGMLTDPVSRRKIHDSELALLGAAARLPLDRREEADAATFLAAFTATRVSSPPPAGVEDLKKLAQDYTRSVADKPKAPKADLERITADRKIDASLVEDLLLEAVNDNLAHRQVWDLVLELRGARKLSDGCLNRLFDFLLARTAKDYPDYSCMMVLKIAPTYGDAARREAIYQQSVDVYRPRPDLQGQLLVALGDDLARQGKKDAAYKTYQQVIGRSRNLTEVFLLAVGHAQDLLLAAQKRDAAIQLYQQLFAETKKPRVDGGYAQSAYYQLGKRLVELLNDAGQKEEARKVQDKVGENYEPTIQD